MPTSTFIQPGLPLAKRRSRSLNAMRLCQTRQATSTVPTFADIKPALSPELISKVNKLYQYPTRTQLLALPPLLRGEDVLLQTPTGTGKTLCYLLACITKINPDRASTQAIILVPTTELGAQVLHVLQKLCDAPVLTLLDDDARQQRMGLRAGPRIIIGTPGRVWKLKKNIRIELVQIIVIDEMDACLRGDGVRDVMSIVSIRGKEGRQMVICSATIPQHRHFLKRGMSEGWLKKGAVHIRGQAAVPENIKHLYKICPQGEKLGMVNTLLTRFKGQVIVFVSESRDVDDIVTKLNHDVVGIRAEWSIGERRHVMKRFRNGDVRVLIATDHAARGIDVPNVVGVIQMDLPKDGNSYLHRAGRCGRMGRRGYNILILTTGEAFMLRRFSNLLNIEIEELT